MVFPRQSYTRDSENQSQKLLFVSMASHCRIAYPRVYSFLAGLGFTATILSLRRTRSSLATLVNLSTHRKRPGSRRRPFLSSSHQRPDSLTSRSPLPRIFRHLLVLFGRFFASGLCLRLFGQLQTVSPRSKSKFSASYLLSGGKSGAKDWSGSTKRVS